MGSGLKYRHNHQRLDFIADDLPGTSAALAAAARLSHVLPAEAYQCLYPADRILLGSLGPAFITKYPYFARAQFERALTISKVALGPDHPDIGVRRNNLGTVLHDMGDLAGARTQYEQALTIIDAALGPDHPTAQTTRANLESPM